MMRSGDLTGYRGGGAPDRDGLFIRGRLLPFERMLSSRLSDDRAISLDADRFCHAPPFPHCVVDDLFGADLLDLVAEEFDLLGAWNSNSNQLETTFRSPPNAHLGPAARAYFHLASDRFFVSYLQRLTGLDHLIPDPLLTGGGLHETRAGGRFRIHRDFNLNERNGLTNALVMITYLNRDWDPAWGGDLELWDQQNCIKSIEPNFGRTVIFRHSDASFHGHPSPLKPPPGRTRRSITSYYYINPVRDGAALFRHSTQYLRRGGKARGRLHLAIKDWMPPALARMIVARRSRGESDR